MDHFWGGGPANFVTELDNLGIDLSIIQSLIGNQQQSLVRSVYSGGPKIEKLKEVINKIDYGSEITQFLNIRLNAFRPLEI